ncbi:MAG: uroporphyrinogen decarboxylase family protein [Planctomycetota bacterium]
MTNEQWDLLLKIIRGAEVDPLPVGFIIDSPWLPPWAGMTMMDYYASEEMWLQSNLQAVRRFPDIMFLPGFWAEWGMCTEPASFGAKCIFHENDFPFAEHISTDLNHLATLDVPDPRQHGLTPFVLKRLSHTRQRIEEAGHSIKFAVARGPLNIAGFLSGNTEMLIEMKIQPDTVHALLEKVTAFLVDWIQVQAETFPTIDGVLILDDLVGFLGEEDFQEFGKPYLKQVFAAIDSRVRFFHNDARGEVCAPHLADIGVNLFNFAFEHSMSDMRQWVGDQVALLGNIPPRDVLAQGSPADVRAAVHHLLDELPDRRRVILSCGGGTPPGVPTENMQAMREAVAK